MLIWGVCFGALRQVGLVTQISAEARAAMLASDHTRTVETHSCFANLPNRPSSGSEKQDSEGVKGSKLLQLSSVFPSPTPGHTEHAGQGHCRGPEAASQISFQPVFSLRVILQLQREHSVEEFGSSHSAVITLWFTEDCHISPQICHLSFLNGREGMTAIVEGNKLEISDLPKGTLCLPR